MLTGIVLMGGKSTRMGKDKSQLSIDNQTFATIAFKKLNKFCDDVFYSINASQNHLNLNPCIEDKTANQGPLSGIISALNTTQQSILVLAVDMPLIKEGTLEKLIQHRDSDLLSTTYYKQDEKIWESFPCIWEIEALPILEEYFESGERSFQKFLNKYGNQPVSINDEREFVNVNTLDTYLSLR